MKILSPVARKLIKNSLSWRNGNATKVATARLRRNSFVLAICLLCVPEFDAASLVIAADPRPDKKGVSVDDCGRKFVNKIPYDVFFDDPIQILKSGQPINSVSTVPEAIPSNSAKPPTNAHADRSPQGTESFWKELIPIDELRDEIKQARGLLTKFTASQGQYNQQFRQIGVQANVIAAMAEIANQHADPISWKDKALFVRQFGHQVTEAANGLGREPFANTRSAFQNLTSSLDGSIPADAGEIDTAIRLSAVIQRKGLMKRIESGRDWLKQEVINATLLKARSEQVRHEATVMMSLMKLLTLPDYEFADHNDYQQFAQSLIDGARQVGSSVDNQSYEQFKQAMDQISKSCTDCHSAYGTE